MNEKQFILCRCCEGEGGRFMTIEQWEPCSICDGACGYWDDAEDMEEPLDPEDRLLK